MPIYNTGDKKSGLTKYKVRVNYTDDSGKAHSLTRVAYGLDAALIYTWKIKGTNSERVLLIKVAAYSICMCAPSISKLTS